MRITHSSHDRRMMFDVAFPWMAIGKRGDVRWPANMIEIARPL